MNTGTENNSNKAKTALGIELGSTRIKAVLIGEDHKTIADSAFSWENRLEDGFWTYDLNDVWAGIGQVIGQLGLPETEGMQEKSISCDGKTMPDALGISAMMHGYLVFDREDNLLVPFRTWRNTNTGPAARALTELFHFNIPQRWSVAHLYQAIMDGEPHVRDIAFITTLAGYVHWQLTGEKALGIGDASGMFPIRDGAYDPVMAAQFKELTGIDWCGIAPRILSAGEPAGCLRKPLYGIPAGTPLCPPEGDAGTGMVATNAIKKQTGNVSAGTSIFAMVVLEQPLRQLHEELDMVTTPDGKPVAMVHCNNCTSDLDAWINLFAELAPVKKADLYDLFYQKAMKGDPDCGGLLSYNYFSGEPIVRTEAGRPLFVRKPDAVFHASNFCRCILYSAVATLKIGMDILAKEGVRLDQMCGHGGLFKSPEGAQIMADALDVPVAVLSSAGEGGAWGIAVLASFLRKQDKRSLEQYLDGIFEEETNVCVPQDEAVQGFGRYLDSYKKGLIIEKTAGDVF